MKRYRVVFREGGNHDARIKADNMYRMAKRHLRWRGESSELYRILYYDCIPFGGTVHNPISKRVVDFSKTDTAIERNNFFDCLKKKRKVALRLGFLSADKRWIINPRKTKDIISGKITVDDLNESDLKYNLRQKEVDIKIGLDIASLSINRLVDRIVLVSGDSDFVPAAKMARRNGIDFILDPMWNPISPSLHEHIDGLRSTSENPRNRFNDKDYPYII